MKTRNYLKVIALAGAMLIAGTTMFTLAEKARVYINPGHGGHDSDDRNVVVAPFAQGDTAGFWESNSNLRKGNTLYGLLRQKGYGVSISRTTNTTADDLPLSTIVRLSNNSGADIFISIHSNATGTTSRMNYPLGLYRGYTGQPEIAGSDHLTQVIEDQLITNQATVWTGNYRIYGDWTFYPQWGDKVGLGVLRGNKVVSMLSEGSFHDYIPEAYRLLTDDYCWLEAWNLGKAVDNYFGYDGNGMGGIVGSIRDSRMLRQGSFAMFGDDTRMPVNGATVKLYFEDDEVRSTVTDDLFNGVYSFRNIAPGEYRIVVQGPEHYEASAEVTVEPDMMTYANFDISRIRNTAPEVVSYSPVWAEGDAPVSCNTPIVLNFNWDMDKTSTEAAFHIEPAVNGTFRWEDTNYRLVFTPTDSYEINTLYTVTVDATAMHAGDMAMEQPFTMQFHTQERNHLNVLAVFPQDGDRVHYKNGVLELRVDSMLSTSNIFDKVTLTDSHNNSITLNRRNYKVSHNGDPCGYARFNTSSALTLGETYTVRFSPEFCDTTGLYLDAPVVNTFTAIDAAQDPETEPLATVVEPEAVTDGEAIPDVGATATLTAATDCLFGSKSLQLKYTFAEQGQKIAVALPTAGDDAFGADNAVGLYLFGDLSFNTVEAVFIDGGTEVRVPLGVIDFHGWRYMQADTKELTAGMLKGVTFTRGDMPLGETGTIRLDNVVKAKSETPAVIADVNRDGNVNVGDVGAVYSVILDPTTPLNADVNIDGQVNVGDVGAVYSYILTNSSNNQSVQLRYAPGADYAVASADGPIDGIELVDANGRVLVRHGGNYINMTKVEHGTYFVKVYYDNTVSTFPVLR